MGGAVVDGGCVRLCFLKRRDPRASPRRWLLPRLPQLLGSSTERLRAAGATRRPWTAGRGRDPRGASRCCHAEISVSLPARPGRRLGGRLWRGRGMVEWGELLAKACWRGRGRERSRRRVESSALRGNSRREPCISGRQSKGHRGNCDLV